MRLLPQKVRPRLALSYAALFLAAGAVLLAVTYTLVASQPSEPVPKPTAQNLRDKASIQYAACKAKAKKGALPQNECTKAFLEGQPAAWAARQRAATLQRLLVFSLVGLGLMTVASGGLGWLMAGRVLRPVRSITAAAQRASQQHLGERLALQGPQDELKELADTFDQMLERLDAAFAIQRRFVADASHELRTPLTVMRTAIEVTMAKSARTPEQLEAMAAKVARSAGQAEALFEALLTLATSEQPLANIEQVDLATAAEDAIEAAAPGIRRLDLQVDTVLEAAPTTGNRRLLERMIGNLVDNAVRHNNPGGWIHIDAGISGGRALVTIANSGPVVPAALLPSLFEPFRRVEERTGVHDGAGLGLAIVRSIGTAHAADVDARSIPAGGLVVTVTLPTIPADGQPPR
ncbi:MAG TPA: HAMP domain-containing sensor histidine kinase [Streptosporangiaceae bacterium]|nr:HAMP domain-containing sensor histidine kinase [Streptosporangiaceae bacterium]